MSMRQVAQLAGVSVSTVSRVVNEHPSIGSATSQLVRDAMAQLNFAPAARAAWRTGRREATPENSIAFLVMGTNGQQTAPAFHRLLRGVSDAAADLNASVVFSFVSDAKDLPRSILTGSIGGLLLHGQRPTNGLASRLSELPTVWLMANRERSLWGDQVMPNNPVIGEVAVKYLAGRGHRHLACLKAESDGWSLRLRAWAFTQAAAEAGLEARILQAPETLSSDMWCSVTLAHTAERLVDQLLAVRPMPTGLFILEDRLLPVISTALTQRGLRSGPGGDVEIISCNNERPHLAGLSHIPATLDIRADVIGRRGVELLLWRMTNPSLSGRVSLLIEPGLVDARPVP